jgi:hypothetical protein
MLGSEKMKKTKMYMMSFILTVLIGLAIFCRTPVSAANVSHEYINPLGLSDSWSFERANAPQDASRYNPPTGWTATNGLLFKGSERADVNEDGIVNMRDTDAIILGFNKRRGQPGWNPLLDVSGNPQWIGDDVINMRDISATILKFNNPNRGAMQGDYTWYIGGPGDNYLSREVEASCFPALSEQIVDFGFWFKSQCSYQPDGGCRAEMVTNYVGGAETGYAGVWVIPDGFNWTCAHVHGLLLNLPISSFQVRIHVKNVAAFMDWTTLTICRSTSQNQKYGAVSVGFNLFSYWIDPSVPPGAKNAKVSIIPSAYAQAADGYKLRSLEIRVTYMSDAGTYDMSIPDWGVTWGNDAGFETDPGLEDDYQNGRYSPAAFMVEFAIGAYGAFGVPSLMQQLENIPMRIYKFVGDTIFGTVVEYTLDYSPSDPQQKTACGIGQDNAVWDAWTMPQELPINWLCFMNSANAAYNLGWNFDTRSHDEFHVQISATAIFAELINGGDRWILSDRATYTARSDLTLTPP